MVRRRRRPRRGGPRRRARPRRRRGRWRAARPRRGRSAARVARTRTSQRGRTRTPSRRASRSASSSAWLKPRSRSRARARGTGTSASTVVRAATPPHCSTTRSARGRASARLPRNLKAWSARRSGPRRPPPRARSRTEAAGRAVEHGDETPIARRSTSGGRRHAARPPSIDPVGEAAPQHVAHGRRRGA